MAKAAKSAAGKPRGKRGIKDDAGPIPPKHSSPTRTTPGKPSSLLDTRVIYCGDCLEQLKQLPGGCVDLIYIDPPFNSNRNYEVFWGETEGEAGNGIENLERMLRDGIAEGRVSSRRACPRKWSEMVR